MHDGFERIIKVHPAYLNDFFFRANHRFVATALWGATDEVRYGVLKHLPILTQEYLLFEIEAYEGRPDDGVDETQQKTLELLCDDPNSEYYQETTISPNQFRPTIWLNGETFEDVVTYVLAIAAKIHSQGMAGIVPDVPNCPIEFLRLGMELLMLNLQWEDINSILWGHIRTHRMRYGQFDASGRWQPLNDDAENRDRMLNFCLVTCSALQLQAHPVLVSRSLRAFTGGDYERLRHQMKQGQDGC